MQSAAASGPKLWLVGDVEHADFAESVALLASTANLGPVNPGPAAPELLVLAESRPGVIRRREVERLRKSAPLAGVVSLLGTWCEGEARTGRPVAGATRLYWYEFPSWWRRQIELRAAGLCPDWARVEEPGFRISDFGVRIGGRVAVEANRWDTVAMLADVLRTVNCEAVWSRPDRDNNDDAGWAAGIWEGGQLSDTEEQRLAAFCARLHSARAPVVALLDFPRRDRCEAARRAGAAAVLGKPWLNEDLVAAIKNVVCMKTRVAA